MPIVRLSDGTPFTIPDGTPSAANAAAIAKGEAYIDQHYQQQAAQRNAPVTPPAWTDEQGNTQQPSKTYSVAGSYPNNAVGQSAAYLDHTGVGKAATGALDYVRSFLPQGSPQREAVEAVGRGATNALTWPHDVPASLINIAKQTAFPQLGSQYDIALAAPALRQSAGIEEASPDMPAWQRYAEAGLAAGLGGVGVGANMLRGAGMGMVSQGGADVGYAVGGAPGAAIGGALGAGYGERAFRAPGGLMPAPRAGEEPAIPWPPPTPQGEAQSAPRFGPADLEPVVTGGTTTAGGERGGEGTLDRAVVLFATGHPETAAASLAMPWLKAKAAAVGNQVLSSDWYNRLYSNVPKDLMGTPGPQAAALPSYLQQPSVAATSPAAGYDPTQQAQPNPSFGGWRAGQ